MADLKIYARTIESEAQAQVEQMAASPVATGSKIRIMPDCHAGKGCTIGTTMTIHDKVCPNLVGVDIGCGMLAVKVDIGFLNLEKLDEIIHRRVPAGFNIHSTAQFNFDLSGLRCPVVDNARAQLSIGTLGGGNHFIEVDKDNLNRSWLIIHSGSRHLGLEIASWYQKLAKEKLTKLGREEIEAVIQELKNAGRQSEIASTLNALKAKCKHDDQDDLAFLTGQDMEDYLHDMRIAQQYAAFNREAIMEEIIEALPIDGSEFFHTVHNYIDLDHMILRKGAVAAYKGETLLIPLNMRDGSLLCVGKGNEDWNCSAPHGAGRLYSRNQAKQKFSVEQYEEVMSGIYTTCVGFDTLDEAPFAYKDMQEIMACIEPTVEIVSRMIPVYNFKASNDRKC